MYTIAQVLAHNRESDFRPRALPFPLKSYLKCVYIYIYIYTHIYIYIYVYTNTYTY